MRKVAECTEKFRRKRFRGIAEGAVGGFVTRLSCVGPWGFIFATRISEILHPLTCSCEVDVVVEKDGGVVDLEVCRVEVEACRVVEPGAC